MIVNSEDEIMNFVNRYNGIMGLHKTVWGYHELQDGKINYDSVRLDRIFFDLDEPDMEPIRRVYEHPQFRHIKKSCNFSGSGFHLFIHIFPNIIHPKPTLGKAQLKIAEILKLDLKEDENSSTIGNIAQMHRILNTWSFKRKRYCVPLHYSWIFGMSYDEICVMAHEQVLENYNYFHGDVLLDISEFDNWENFNYRRKIKDDDIELDKNPQILEKLGYSKDSICNEIGIYFRPEANFHDRKLLILYFKDVLVMNEEETIQILYNILDEQKFYHSRETQDVERLYTSGYKFPLCKTCKKRFKCNLNRKK